MNSRQTLRARTAAYFGFEKTRTRAMIGDRPYAAYMIRLERNDHEIFSASADLNPSPLLQVAGRNYDIRLPLAAMGIMNSTTTRITIGDASNSPVTAIPVQRYPR